MKSLEIRIRKFLLNLLLRVIEKKSLDYKIPENPKILVIRLNKIGDALVTTPLLSLLNTIPGAKLDVLADRKNHFIFHRNSIVNQVKVFEKGIAVFFQTVKWINRQNYDVMIDAHDDVSTTVSFLVAASRVPHKVALEKENKRIFNHTVTKPNPANTHIVRRIAEIAKIFGIEFGNEKLKIFYEPEDESLKTAEQFISANIPNKKYLLGVNISAGSDARFWGVENYKNVLGNIEHKDKIGIILLRAPSNSEKALQISEGKYPVFEDKSFDEFAAMISKLNMIFTPDTSAVHLASAFGVPVFGLYVHYNTEDMIWSPYNTEFDYILTKESTLSNISYHIVIKKLNKFIERTLNETQNT